MKVQYLFFFIIFSMIIFSFFNSVKSVDTEGSQLVICNKYTCPKGRGKCNELNECICEKDYDTIDDLARGDFYCNYRKKSKVISFLLEFVIGFGSGHFYMGHNVLGTIKMIFTGLFCLVFCQYPSISKITELKKFARPVEILLLGIWLVWQLLDGILIIFGAYNDGNGYPLRGL